MAHAFTMRGTNTDMRRYVYRVPRILLFLVQPHALLFVLISEGGCASCRAQDGTRCFLFALRSPQVLCSKIVLLSFCLAPQLFSLSHIFLRTRQQNTDALTTPHTDGFSFRGG